VSIREPAFIRSLAASLLRYLFSVFIACFAFLHATLVSARFPVYGLQLTK